MDAEVHILPQIGIAIVSILYRYLNHVSRSYIQLQSKLSTNFVEVKVLNISTALE